MRNTVKPEQRVTDSIIAALENGTAPWRQSWIGGGNQVPTRSNGEPYRGINVLLLMISQYSGGYGANRWMTFKQAEALGGNVRKGSKSTYVIKYGTYEKKVDGEAVGDEGSKLTAGYIKGYNVFNVDQIEGLPEQYYDKPEVVAGHVDWNMELEATLAQTGANISWSGTRAYFAPGPDHIVMPDRERFSDAEQAYATLCHELVHWTGHKDRLARDFSGKKEAYAYEELVAELGAAFLGSHFGFRPDHIEDHASYIASWLKVLKNDPKAIISAASKAQTATDYIRELIAVEAQVAVAA